MPSVDLAYTPEFRRNLRVLAKSYRHIRSDVEPVLQELSTGKTPGDQIQGTGYALFKVRVKNSDINKGKSSGYRLIYYIKTTASIVLVTIYSKLEQTDISPKEIRAILTEFGAQTSR